MSSTDKLAKRLATALAKHYDVAKPPSYAISTVYMYSGSLEAYSMGLNGDANGFDYALPTSCPIRNPNIMEGISALTQ